MIDAIRKVEPSVIMGDANQDFALCAQVGQNFFIKDRTEMRVLIRGPFIKHEDGFFFQKGGDQGQAFALALRRGCC